jgi:hypothetical protein
MITNFNLYLTNKVHAYDEDQTGNVIYGIITTTIIIIITTRKVQSVSLYAVCLTVATGGTCSFIILFFGR